MTLMTFDPYKILLVAPDATDETISTSYRSLARKHHPDLAGESSTVAMSRINAAWELIGTAKARAAFETERRAQMRAVLPADPTPAEARAAATTPGFEPLPDGTGAAGRPPGRPSGSVLTFGRHVGWSIGEIARVDPGYLQWLEEKPQGRPYIDEIEATLRQLGWRHAQAEDGTPGQRRKRRRWLRS